MLVYFILIFVFVGMATLVAAGLAISFKFESKSTNIAAIVLIVIIIVHVIAVQIVNNKDQEKFEEAYILGLEKTIEEFKSENPGIIKNVTYDLTFNEMKTVDVVFYVESTQEIHNGSYVSLFHPDVRYESIMDGYVSTATYGKVYINDVLEYENERITSSPSGDHKCSVCGKSYSSGGTSNMCSQCYKNYKYAADAAGY